MSSRRRTYVWRTAFAAVLLAFVYWNQLERLQTYSSPLEVLGSGRWLFQIIISWLAVIVTFGMPLLTCGAIVSERERNTLALLLTTQMSSGSLVLEKLASRLYVMLTLVMVSLPLMALAYSMGGVTTNQIIAGVITISSLSVLTGSFGVFQSVRAASAVGALTSTLIWIGVVSMFCGAGLLIGVVGESVIAATISGIIMLAISACVLLAAAKRIPQAAIEPPRSRLLAGFRKADSFFRSVNSAFGGIELLRDRSTLPGDLPLLWKERYKRALGQTHHLVRIIALLEIPTVFAVTLVISSHRSSLSQNPLGGFIAFLWIIAVLIVAVRTVGIWPQERSRETLDVLLTTPLTGREMIGQTMQGVRRTMVAVAIPIVTAQLATAFIQTSWTRSLLYVYGCCLSLICLLPLTAWAAMLISLKVRTQTRATGIAIVVLSVVLFVPRVVVPGPELHHSEMLQAVLLTGQLLLDPSFFSSVAGTVFDESSLLAGFELLFWSVAAVWYAVVIWLIRRRCVSVADRWLSRCSTQHLVAASCSAETK